MVHCISLLQCIDYNYKGIRYLRVWLATSSKQFRVKTLYLSQWTLSVSSIVQGPHTSCITTYIYISCDTRSVWALDNTAYRKCPLA